MKRLLISLLLLQTASPFVAKADNDGSLLTGLGIALAGLSVVGLAAGAYQYTQSDGYLLSDAGNLLNSCKSEYRYLRSYTTIPVADDTAVLHSLYLDIKTHHTDADCLYERLRSDVDRIERTYTYISDRCHQRIIEGASYQDIQRLESMCEAVYEQRTYLNNLFLVIKGQRAFLMILPHAQAVIDTWQGFAGWYGSVYGASESALHTYVCTTSKEVYPYLHTVEYLNKVIDRFERRYTHSLYNYSFIRQATIALSSVKDLQRAILGSYGYAQEVNRKREDERREREVRAAEDRARAAKREADAAEEQVRLARRQAQAAEEQARLARQQANVYQPATPVLEVNVNLRG